MSGDKRLEPDVDIGIGVHTASISVAISLKRIADSLEKIADAEANEYGEKGVNAVTGPLARMLRDFTHDLGMTLRNSK